ncbi:bifunctional DNA primase/polymerase [Sphaerisporangium aureirubrum]|uniref:Bifunctional DNA primase/polymerase n=1 Tax=Sphaerisporangium aureirubrum TaxID=1544736 RepID=A0ABW1NM03_9ACTN
MTAAHLATPRDARAYLAAYALAAAARGWHVFPITPRGKYPLKNTRAWEATATTDPETITATWARAPYNIGIATGPSALIVIDLDQPKPDQTPPPRWDLPGITNGADVLAALCRQAGQSMPPDTFTVTTRRGGTHLYYAIPPGHPLGNTAGDKGRGLGWLIDTRASGGYVVGPGSYVALPDGAGSYTVTNPAPAAPLPGWLADRLTALPEPTALSTGDFLATLPAHRLTRYGEAALRGEIDRVATARPGTRNPALNLAAWKLGKLIASGALPRHLAEQGLQAAAETAYAAGDPDSPSEIRAVITAGINAGINALPAHPSHLRAR